MVIELVRFFIGERDFRTVRTVFDWALAVLSRQQISQWIDETGGWVSFSVF